MNGKCLKFSKLDNGNLQLTLTELGRQELPGLIEQYGEGSSRTMWELLEYQLCNGWENLQPERIGAMTDCDLILTDDVQHSEDGREIVSLGKVYWHANYMVENPIESLRSDGLILIGVS